MKDINKIKQKLKRHLQVTTQKRKIVRHLQH